MSQVFVFILGILLGIFAVFALSLIRANKVRVKGADIIEEQREKAEQNKKKLLEFMKSKEKVANNDVEKFLGVSDATAERYLNELERDGIVRQVGKTGRPVYYEIIKK